MTETAPIPADLSFEDALQRLEAIVSKLESGQAPLEESIALYEEGARLKAHCENRLKAAQLRVEKIVVGPDGQAKGVPVAVPRSISEVLASEHLAEREFWQPVTVGDGRGMAPSIPLLDSGSWGPSGSSTREFSVSAGATG